MKRVRVGISVGHDRVRLLALRGTRAQVVAAAEFAHDTDLEATVAQLLREAGLPRFPEPRATLVLGPARSQFRELTGLPESRDRRLLGEVIRQDPGRFFLRNGIPLLTTGVRPLAPGAAWAAALDETAVLAVQCACAAAGIRLDAAAPLASALARHLGDGEYILPDGPVTGEIEVVAGEVTQLRRRAALPGDGGELPVPRGLTGIGTSDEGYGDAYAAAVLPQGEPVAIRFAPADAPTWRVGLAAAVLLLTIGAAVALPVRRTEATGRVARAELQRTAAQRHRAAVEAEGLVEVTDALREVADFAIGQRSAVGLVSGLARALPPGSALVSVHADSAGGNLVVLAPRAADVLSRVERMPSIRGAALTGAVTRELVGTQTLERVGIRFGWERVAGTASAARP